MNKGTRPIRVDGETAYIPLTQGKEAIVDVSDLHLVENKNWYFNKGYAKTTVYVDGKGHTSIRLHRLLMSAPDGMSVDHKNLDKLDNRRSNLRLATGAENQRNRGAYSTNTSGYKGVVWHKTAQKWRARIVCEGKKHSLGLHMTKEQAYAAYCEAARRMHGNFARVA